MHIDPKDIVEQLRHNLERYPYGDGFPVIRELLQNADDARAAAVSLHLLEGWPEAKNPLLQGPGLLLVNDGDFDDRSALGMQTLGGSVKALDETAVGRFGLGQKSVFHLCDAFVVVPDGHKAHAHFVVNPFETLGRPGDACLDWRGVESADVRRIAEAGARFLPGRRRLNLWFPLRRQGLRPKPKSNGIVAVDIAPQSLAPLADRRRLAELLAGLRHVRRLTLAMGGAAARLVGYALAPGDHSFGGPLGPGLSCRGRERRADDAFRRDLRQSPHWPRTRNRDTDEEEPQKATPHGAVILVCEADGAPGISADWAVLLPVAEALPALRHAGEGRLKLLLHGCFFVDSGRKAVTGLDTAGAGAPAGADEHRIRADWNRALRDALVLPLVPAVLHDAREARMLSPATLAAAVAALAASTFGRAHRRAICAEQALARVAERAGKGAVARWRLLPAGAPLCPLPAPDDKGGSRRPTSFRGFSTGRRHPAWRSSASPGRCFRPSLPGGRPGSLPRCSGACPPRSSRPRAARASLPIFWGSPAATQRCARRRPARCWNGSPRRSPRTAPWPRMCRSGRSSPRSTAHRGCRCPRPRRSAPCCARSPGPARRRFACRGTGCRPTRAQAGHVMSGPPGG